MIKIILPVILVLGVVLGALYLIKVRFQSSLKAPPAVVETGITQESNNGPTEVPASLPAGLDSASPLPENTNITTLITKVNSLENKIKVQDNTITDLTTRLRRLEAASSAAPTAVQAPATTQAPVYIYALGTGGSVTSQDWQEVSTLSITIDPASYPGYKNMSLEALIRVKDGNGTAYARLYSSSDGQSIGESQVQTSSYLDTWVASSQTFKVSSKKAYTFQLKSLTGYDAYISNARVKVNY